MTEAGHWQWAVQYGDGELHVCEGTEGFETPEAEARRCVEGNAMIRADHPCHPAARVVRRWITTGPWIPALPGAGVRPVGVVRGRQRPG